MLRTNVCICGMKQWSFDEKAAERQIHVLSDHVSLYVHYPHFQERLKAFNSCPYLEREMSAPPKNSKQNR